MATITLADVMIRARQKADMVNSNFIEDPELINYVNEAYFNWYDLVVTAFEDYYLDEPTEFTILPGAPGEIALPADFYKLAGLDKASDASGDRFYPLKKTLWRDRNRTVATFSSYGLTPKTSYRIIKDKILLIPKDDSDGAYKLWYIPLASPLADSEGSDTFEAFNGFENLLIVDVAIKMLNKEESDPSMLLLERARLEKKMREMLIDRDINNGERIEEVGEDAYGEGNYW